MNKKRKIFVGTLIMSSLAGIVYLYKKNRELSGIIENQKTTIDGLMREVKNLSYHLGKKSNLIN